MGSSKDVLDLKNLSILNSSLVLDEFSMDYPLDCVIDVNYESMEDILTNFNIKNVLFYSVDIRCIKLFNKYKKDGISLIIPGYFSEIKKFKPQKEPKFVPAPKLVKGENFEVSQIYDIFQKKAGQGRYYVYYDNSLFLRYKSNFINVINYFNDETMNNSKFTPEKILITRDKMTKQDPVIDRCIGLYPNSEIILLVLDISIRLYNFYNERIIVYTLQKNLV